MPHEHGIQQEVVRDVAQSRSNIVMKNPELRQKSCSKGAFKPHQDRRKHHHHSRKHSYREEKGAVFEGERVSYLVGQSEAEEAHPSAGNGERTCVQEDDYVLRKLFKKSGETFMYKVCSIVLIFNLDTIHVSLDFMRETKTQ
jgi:hypothetical protein